MGKKNINQFQPSNSIRAHVLPLVLNYNNCEYNSTEMNDKKRITTTTKQKMTQKTTKRTTYKNNLTHKTGKLYHPKKCGFHFKLNKLTGILAVD